MTAGHSRPMQVVLVWMILTHPSGCGGFAARHRVAPRNSTRLWMAMSYLVPTAISSSRGVQC